MQFRSITRDATQRPSLIKRTTELRPALRNVLRVNGDGAVCSLSFGAIASLQSELYVATFRANLIVACS